MALQPLIDSVAELGFASFGRRSEDGHFAPLYARNTSSSSASNATTVNMFVDSPGQDYSYEASVVTACVDQTVYAIQCATGAPVSGIELCGTAAVPVTVTVDPSHFIASTVSQTTTLGVAVTISARESCDLQGTTAATCTNVASLSAQGTSTSTTIVSTITGSDYHRFDVSITAGAEKLASPTATCRSASAAGKMSVGVKAVALGALVGVAGILGFM